MRPGQERQPACLACIHHSPTASTKNSTWYSSSSGGRSASPEEYPDAIRTQSATSGEVSDHSSNSNAAAVAMQVAAADSSGVLCVSDHQPSLSAQSCPRPSGSTKTSQGPNQTNVTRRTTNHSVVVTTGPPVLSTGMYLCHVRVCVHTPTDRPTDRRPTDRPTSVKYSTLSALVATGSPCATIHFKATCQPVSTSRAIAQYSTVGWWVSRGTYVI